MFSWIFEQISGLFRVFGIWPGTVSTIQQSYPICDWIKVLKNYRYTVSDDILLLWIRINTTKKKLFKKSTSHTRFFFFQNRYCNRVKRLGARFKLGQNSGSGSKMIEFHEIVKT